MHTIFRNVHIDYLTSSPAFGPQATTTLSVDAFDQAEQEITSW